MHFKMPIVIKNPKWSQTDNEVHIILPLNNVCSSGIKDVFISNKFIKVNFSPYYFEAILSHEIDANESKCKICENYLKFVLKKCVANETWEHFERTHGAQQLDIKKELLQENDANVAAEIENQRKMKADFKRLLVDIELKRDQKKREQMDAVDQKIQEVEQKEISQLVRKEVEIKQCPREPRADAGKLQKATTVPKIKRFTKDYERTAEIPSVRSFGTIEVSFSERRFVTPQRESQEAAEQEWILKQNKIKSNIGFSDDDLAPEERNPEWLLNKGNEFVRKQNYKAAISAYSTGISIAEEPALLLLNRAVAHFHMENYERCAMDTSKAYDLLVPAIQVNLSSRIRCLSLRGAALIKLGFMKQGHRELLAARELDPHNEQLQQDIEMVECELRKLH